MIFIIFILLINFCFGYNLIYEINNKHIFDPFFFENVREKVSDDVIILKKFSVEVTKCIANSLAGADHTGHNVLHTNSMIIHRILDAEFLDNEIKKDLSLMCIKFAQFGDHTGHNILTSFHHFVDKYL